MDKWVEQRIKEIQTNRPWHFELEEKIREEEKKWPDADYHFGIRKWLEGQYESQKLDPWILNWASQRSGGDRELLKNLYIEVYTDWFQSQTCTGMEAEIERYRLEFERFRKELEKLKELSVEEPANLERIKRLIPPKWRAVREPEPGERTGEVLTEADVLSRYGLKNEAAEKLEEFLAEEPGNLEIISRLITLKLGTGDLQEVAELANKLLIVAKERAEPEAWEEVRNQIVGEGFTVVGEQVVAPAEEVTKESLIATENVDLADADASRSEQGPTPGASQLHYHDQLRRRPFVFPPHFSTAERYGGSISPEEVELLEQHQIFFSAEHLPRHLEADYSQAGKRAVRDWAREVLGDIDRLAGNGVTFDYPPVLQFVEWAKNNLDESPPESSGPSRV